MRATGDDQKKWLKRFMPMWIGQAVSLLGSGLVQFALVWYLTQKTGSATVLATATFVSLVPEVVLGPFIGALVDRWNRKLVMMAADGAIAVLTALLGVLYWSGNMALWHIYVLMFLRAIGGVFHFAALQASISLMVPDEHLARVAGINQSLRGALNIVTPPLGALLMTLVPLYGILAIDVTTAVIAVSILFFVTIPQVRQPEGQQRVTVRSVISDVGEGFRYVRGWPGLLAVLLMATVLNFLSNPSFSFMPLLVTEHFKGNAWHLSAMESLFGIGVVAGGLLLGAWGGFRKKIYTSLTGLVVMGLAMLMVAAAPVDGFSMALVGMTVIGMMNAIVNGPLFAVVQARVAPEMQGRVFTMIGSIASAMTPLSMLIAGPGADLFGVRAWYWLAAIGTLVLGGGSFFVPVILHLEDDGQAPGMQPAPQESGD